MNVPVETVKAVWPKHDLKRQNAEQQRRKNAIDRIHLLMMRNGLKAKDLGQLFQ